MKKITFLLSTALMITAVPWTANEAQAASIVVSSIDDFTVLQTVSKTGRGTFPPNNRPSVASITSDLLGSATRRITGNNRSPGTVTVDVNQSIAGTFAVANGPNVRSLVTSTYTFTGAKDFTFASVADRLVANIVNNDLPIGIIFSFTDVDNTVGTLSYLTTGKAETVGLLFSTATITTPGTNPILDFSQIKAFSFTTNNTTGSGGFPGSQAAADIAFSFISVGQEFVGTPEPSSFVGLLTIGLLGASSFLKRKKKD